MEKLGLYYIDLNESLGEDFSEYKFNAQGIPLVRFNRSPDWQHNPVTICQYALTKFNQYKKATNVDTKHKFLTQANWLLNNYEIGPNNSAVWYYRLNIPFYKLKKPWVSGMAQGEALSVLLRAYQLTKEGAYIDLAHQVWNIFSVSMENGGVIGTFPDGTAVIEEYPTNPSSCVLNGFILALFGVYDYLLITHDKEVQLFLERCIEGLKNNLNRYDTSFWSLYDLLQPFRLTSRSYHRLHLLLLKTLYEITGEKLFLDTSVHWSKYLKNPICNIKWVINKIKQRINNRE